MRPQLLCLGIGILLLAPLVSSSTRQLTTACSIELSSYKVNRGERLTLTARVTLTAYGAEEAVYDYKWGIVDPSGRPLLLFGTGSSVAFPTNLPCGTYAANLTVTASIGSKSGQTSCTTKFEITEPECPTLTCEISTPPVRVLPGDRVTFRAYSSGADNPKYTWATTGGQLSSTSRSEVTLDTTGVTLDETTVTVNVGAARTRCGQPCPGSSCSATLQLRRVPASPIILRGCDAPLSFASRSANLANEHDACLNNIATRLQQDRQLFLVIDGHSDSRERTAVALKRANNVRNNLSRTRGIDPKRIAVRSFGDSCPHESNTTESNRRVESWMVPSGFLVDDVARFKKCAPGATPRPIN